MDKSEAAEATAAIGMMLKAFPSSQSTITADSARVYLFSVEDLPLEAVKRACRAFVRGDVAGRNHAFAPSAPELAQLAKEIEGKIRVEQFESSHHFIAEGTETWQKLMLHRGRSSNATFIHDGMTGWHFPHEEVLAAQKLALPASVSEGQQQINAVRAKHLITKAGVKFSVGDPDSELDMGQREAS